MKAIYNFKTKQEGYGRQGLYFEHNGEWHYLGSVFPNVKEHYNIDIYENLFLHCDEQGEAILDEDGNETYLDWSGNVVNAVDSINAFLSEKWADEIAEMINEMDENF